MLKLVNFPKFMNSQDFIRKGYIWAIVCLCTIVYIRLFNHAYCSRTIYPTWSQLTGLNIVAVKIEGGGNAYWELGSKPAISHLNVSGLPSCLLLLGKYSPEVHNCYYSTTILPSYCFFSESTHLSIEKLKAAISHLNVSGLPSCLRWIILSHLGNCSAW